MSIIVDCPSCGRKLRVPDELLGRQVKCPSCEMTFEAATAEEAADSSPVAPVEEELEEVTDQRQEPKRRPTRRRYDDEDEDYDGPPRRRSRRRWGLDPHRGSLILTLGILSFFIVPLAMGPVAWILGHHDLNEMRAGRMDPEGEGSTNAGRICGMISTLMWGTLLCCIFGFYAMVFTALVSFH